MRRPDHDKLMIAQVGAALVAGTIGYFVVLGKNNAALEAERGTTTQSVVAAAGARSVPLDPKLKGELK